MLANLLLIILGILEVIFTLPSFIICLREICYCYSDSEVLMAAAAVAGSAEQERKLLTKNFLYVVTTYLFYVVCINTWVSTIILNFSTNSYFS